MTNFEAKGTGHREGAEEFTHESYGLARFSRVSGGARQLFGSHLRGHNTFISLTISRAKRIHDLSRDWYSSAGMGNLIEVHLSAAQFAELLTTMNMGEGVPCTISRLDGKMVENPPDEDTETEKVKTGFKGKTDQLAQKLEAFKKEVGELFAKKSVGKRDREEVLKQIGLFIQEVRCNMPFVLESFEESTEKITTTAKAEVEAFATHAVQLAGLEALGAPALGKAPEAPELEEASGGREE